MCRILFAVALCLAGCSRSYYRESADRETYPIVAERVTSPASAVGRIQVEPYPRSRLADPTNPDHPPKPPDDPSAAAFMAHPGKLRGAHGWEKDGLLARIEPGGWEQALGANAAGTVTLTQTKAAELALLNSREYQTQLEAVYLEALALTLNRFEFDLRWFGRSGTNYARTGAGGFPTETNTLTATSDIGFNRNLAAGGQLLIDFANSFVWEFTGRTHTVTGTASANFLQPLLRNFGRKVRLESLTQAERDTLYAVRDFARFRKQFWADVAVQSGGYLNLLLLLQNVRNAQANLKSQEENYRLYQELFKVNRTRVVDVDQVFQGLLAARLQVSQAEVALQDALDQYKLRLGLPPRTPVELDDSLLEPFVLIAPATDALRAEVESFARGRAAELGAPPTAAESLAGYDQLLALAGRSAAAIDAATADLTRWKADLAVPTRPGDDAEGRARAIAAYVLQATIPADQTRALATLISALKAQRAAVSPAGREAAWLGLVSGTQKLSGILDAAIAAQTQARIYLIRLPDVDANEAAALAFAKENRLDLQNQLGRVTDSWRKVTVAANQLEPDLNLTADASLVTAPTARNPFAFSNDASRFSIGVQFDGPLNRVAERNAYRASQIAYQRARRTYMALDDTVELQVRSDLRAIRQQRLSFEIARQSLIAAARQLESERLLLTAPNQAQQGNVGDATLRTLRALDQLLVARNALAGSFVSYEQQRIRLLLNLEAMQLDDRGFPTNVTVATGVGGSRRGADAGPPTLPPPTAAKP